MRTGDRTCKDTLSEEQLDRMLAPSEQPRASLGRVRTGAVIGGFFMLGLRSVELRHIRTQDIEHDARGEIVAVRIQRSKTPSGIRRMVLNPRCQSLWKRWENARKAFLDIRGIESEWFFMLIQKAPRIMGVPSDAKPGDQMCHATPYDIMRRAYATIGITNMGTHTGRRTFITSLARSPELQGNPMAAQVLAKAAGHKSCQSTEPYIRVQQQEVDAIIMGSGRSQNQRDEVLDLLRKIGDALTKN